MDSELQDALDRLLDATANWTLSASPLAAGEVAAIVEAARKVANPDIAAIAEALADYAGYDGLGPGPEYWRGMAKEAIAALNIKEAPND